MSSGVPNYHPYYASMMQYSSQPPPYNPYMPVGNENVPNIGATEFPEFSTQMSLGNTSGAKEDDSSTNRKKGPNWTTEQNLVLLSGWIKYGTDSVVGKNQKSEAYWGKIVEYCNEHCSFDPPRDGDACRNRWNYINKLLAKWTSAYDNALRMQQSGWSENDILAKARELYKSSNKGNFNYMSEWEAVRDQPRYSSQVRQNRGLGSKGSGSSGSKRACESDAGDSNSVESISRPIGKDAAKKKGKKKGKGLTLEVVTEEWNEFKKYKDKEIERLEKVDARQEETNKVKKMEMYVKLTEWEHLDERSLKLLKMLSEDLVTEE